MIQPCQICGRCGYDLTGVVASWDVREHPSCDRRGTCSECGHLFSWTDIFNAWRLDKPWLVEHAPTRRAFLARIPKTALRAALPWRFWAGLSMQARVRPWLALLGAVLLLLPVQLAVSSHETYRVVRNDFTWTQNWAGSNGYSIGALDESSLPGLLASGLAGPIVRPQYTPAYTRIPQGAARVPLALTGSQPVGTSHVSPMFVPQLLPWWFIAGVIAVLTWVVLLALLPTTRAVGKLRWAHVARSAIYSGAGVLVLSEVLRLALYRPLWGGYDLEWPSAVLVLGWTTSWWWCAILLGWRLERGPLVALLLTVATLLAGFTAGLLYDPFILTDLF